MKSRIAFDPLLTASFQEPWQATTAHGLLHWSRFVRAMNAAITDVMVQAATLLEAEAPDAVVDAMVHLLGKPFASVYDDDYNTPYVFFTIGQSHVAITLDVVDDSPVWVGEVDGREVARNEDLDTLRDSLIDLMFLVIAAEVAE